MRGLRFLRACAALGAIAAGTVVSAGPATATTKMVTCTSLSGNLNSAPPVTFSLSGCTGNTGGSGHAQGTTITWANGRTTFLTTAAFTPSGTPKRGNCGDLSGKWAVTDTVAGDGTGSIKVPGKVSAKVCILNEFPDPWSLAPGSVFTLR
jgi:hypothetical protein